MCGYYLNKQVILRGCSEEPPQRKLLAEFMGLWELDFVVQSPIRWMGQFAILWKYFVH